MPAATWWGHQGIPEPHSDVPHPSESGEQLNTEETRDLLGATALSATKGVAISNSQCSVSPAFPAFTTQSTMDEITALLAEANQLKLKQDFEASMKNTYLMAFPSTLTIA